MQQDNSNNNINPPKRFLANEAVKENFVGFLKTLQQQIGCPVIASASVNVIHMDNELKCCILFDAPEAAKQSKVFYDFLELGFSQWLDREKKLNGVE